MENKDTCHERHSGYACHGWPCLSWQIVCLPWLAYRKSLSGYACHERPIATSGPEHICLVCPEPGFSRGVCRSVHSQLQYLHGTRYIQQSRVLSKKREDTRCICQTHISTRVITFLCNQTTPLSLFTARCQARKYILLMLGIHIPDMGLSNRFNIIIPRNSNLTI